MSAGRAVSASLASAPRKQIEDRAARMRAWAAQIVNPARRRFLSHALGSQTPPRSMDRIRILAPLALNNGIARGATLQYEAMKRLGLDVQLVDVAPARRRPFWRAPHKPGTTYIVHCGGPETAAYLASAMPPARDGYRIGYWAWELAEPPSGWRRYAELVHEIWTPSRHAHASLSKLSNIPVTIAAHIVEPGPLRARSQSAPFTVLALADSRSSYSRKNPAGAIAAFRAAFGDRSDARLLLKLGGFDSDVEVLSRSVTAPNIKVLRGFLSEQEMEALFEQADVLLSLHRAEGFGLPLLEAMARGIPVVATAWSGNLDFMSDQDSVLVPFRLVPVLDEAGVYKAGSWAEPSICFAAHALQRLEQDRPFYERLSKSAHESARAVARRSLLALPIEKARYLG